MKIDKTLLPMKGHYFLFNAGTGLVIPFMPVLAKELGFSSIIVGTIYTCLPILGLIAKPMMGAIADRLRWQKGMFITFILVTMLSLFIIPWIPKLPLENQVEIHCDADSVVKINSESVIDDSCALKEMSNSSIRCHMVCEADSEFIENVCEKWKQPKYCAAIKNSEHFLLSVAKQNMTKQTNESSQIKVKYAAQGLQTLEFDAVLLPQHIDQVNKSIFIRLGRVIFPGSESVVPYCGSLEEAKCNMDCDNQFIKDLMNSSPHISDSEALGLYQFWMFCLPLVIGWVSNAIVTSISDAICFELLGDFPSKYGYQRLWGSIGWGLLSFLGGFVIDQFSRGQSSKNHTPIFILMVITLSINVLVAWKLKYKQVKTSASIIQDVGRLLSETKVLIFIVWCICAGMCTALVWNFLFWFLEDLPADCDTKSNIKTLEGLAMIIQCLGGELPFFFLSGWVLKKIGHIHAMSMILFAFGVRFLLYSILTNPWWVLPIEFFNGITFGMAYATMASYASIVAPPGTEATTQGLVGAMFEGLGVSAGSFLGGLLFGEMKGSAVFQLFGIGAIVCCIIHSIIQYFLSKNHTVLNMHEKDFKSTRYASPNDALHMLEDSLQEFNSPR